MHVGESAKVFRLLVAYDGTGFAGWQIQPGKRTVQEELLASLRALGDPQVRCVASGRTDAGVHAQGQVVGVRTTLEIPVSRLKRAIQARLPEDIVVRSVAEAPLDFDPTRQALSKTYRYSIRYGCEPDVFSRRYALHHPGPLDLPAMEVAAKHFLGTHDFKAFETRWPNRATSIRTIKRAEVTGGEGWCHVEVESNGFLYNMMRTIVGTLLVVGRGGSVDLVRDVLVSGDRTRAGPTAPPHGLCLIRVEYPSHLNHWPQ